MKLDVGCGGRGTMHGDFTGIDIYPPPKTPRSKGEYVQLDFLKDELPFKDVEFIIASHIIEHLMPEDGIILIQRAVELLKKGCELIVSCPDFELFAKMYLERNVAFWDEKENHYKGPTFADKFNHFVHQNTHKWQYDQDSLIALAKRAGAINIKELPKNHKWCMRPDHEIGIIIKK